VPERLERQAPVPAAVGAAAAAVAGGAGGAGAGAGGGAAEAPCVQGGGARLTTSAGVCSLFLKILSSQVLSPQDVAIFGGLCALAVFDRSELKSKVFLLYGLGFFLHHPLTLFSAQVLDNASFKNFLELVPQVRELITDFYNSRYASCLNYLQQLRV